MTRLGSFFGDVVWGVSLCDLSFRRDDKIEDVVWGVSLCDLFRHGEHAVEMTSLRMWFGGASLGIFVEFLYVIASPVRYRSCLSFVRNDKTYTL